MRRWYNPTNCRLHPNTMPDNDNKPQQTEFLPAGITAAEYEKQLALHDFVGKTVGQKLDEFAKIPDDKAEKGAQFEKLTQWALPLIKSLEIASVKKPKGGDIGVDFIATHNDGYKIAIQCKFWTSKNIYWGDISTFIGAAKQAGIEEKWLVCGAKGLSSNIDTTKPGVSEVKVIDMRQFCDTTLTTAPREPRQPLPLQRDAIDAVVNGLQNAKPGAHGERRGTLIMACGSGKTFTALRIAEHIAVPENTAANLLFIAPSIALVAQARREWLEHSARRLRTLVICSDNTAGDSEDIQPNEIAGRVSTDPQEIAAHLSKKIRPGEARVTFCTYQSLDKLIAAQHEHGAPTFDLAIVDEAHRTAGVLEKQPSDEKFTYGQFLRIHDATQILAARRLYMTATPRIYGASATKKKIDEDSDKQLVDMSNPVYFGEKFYNLTFKQAVDADILCDYRVIALGVTESIIGAQLTDQLIALNDELDSDLSRKSLKGKPADAQSVLALGAIALAINGFFRGQDHPASIARTIAFASNIRRSKWLKKALQNAHMKGWVTGKGRRDAAHSDPNNPGKPRKALTIDAEHLDGTSSAVNRRSGLNWLRDAEDKSPRLITNAQLFTEGVDVPALNAIAFLDPRKSKIDTVQAVGRVMRRDPNNPAKIFGYIIVPVIMPPGANLLTTLQENKSRFKSLGNVLGALRSHDGNFDTDLHVLLGEVKPNDNGESPPTHDVDIQESILDDHTKRAIFAQLAKGAGISGNPGKNVADEIANDVNRAAAILQDAGAAHIIAKIIGTPLDNAQESCKTAALLLVNACIMHKRLDATGKLDGLTKIEIAKTAACPPQALYEAWRTVLKKDYSPIFQDAAVLVKKFAELSQCHPAIQILAGCAMDKAARLNDLGFDHAGPLYHRILGSAKSDGAFYTKNLSAYLLAGLAFDDSFVDWTNKNAVKKLRIADPACGTGTLLMAALKAIKDKAAAAQNLSADEKELLHKHLVEETIHGFDINQYSIQLAACNLTIGAPNTDYRGMNLHTLQHGPLPGSVDDSDILQRVKPENVRHGTLEILFSKAGKESLQVRIAELDDLTVYGTDAEKHKKKFRPPQNLDAVIFNPPFTDTQLQSGRFNDATKKAMDERLKQIHQHVIDYEPDTDKVIGKRSIGPYFNPVAHRLINKNKGVLAKVIPSTACTSENGRDERRYLAKHFHIEMVVTSHDPKNINFSENTNIHECLLVARRFTGSRPPTRFIQLIKNPQDSDSTHANRLTATDKLIEAIQSGQPSHLFNEIKWQADKVQDGNWSPVQWHEPTLAHIADEMNNLQNCVTAGDIYDIAHNEVAFRLNFDYSPSEDGNAFCTIGGKVMQTIEAHPEAKATPKPSKENRAKNLWEKASHLLITSRLSTTSTRLTAIYSDTPALGSAFNPIGNIDKNTAKAYSAFMNSSFGIIQMLNRRTSKLTYPTYESSHLKTLQLPDPKKVDLSILIEAFEKVKNIPLGRLRDCDEHATPPPPRKIPGKSPQNIGPRRRQVPGNRPRQNRPMAKTPRRRTHLHRPGGTRPTNQMTIMHPIKQPAFLWH